MVNVRVFFTKKGEARYLSHLDVMRCFIRAINCSGLKVWYTQGFNTHMYLMFPCALSLGYESEREAVDFRLIEDEALTEDIAARINRGLPQGIRIFEVAEPVMKHTEIAFSQWQIVFRCDDAAEAEDVKAKLDAFFSREEIPVLRRTKRGEGTENVLPLIRRVSYRVEDGVCTLDAVLSQTAAGSLNPRALLDAFTLETGIETETCEITRIRMTDASEKEFR